MKRNHQYRPYKMLTREEELAAWERGDHNALVESVWPFVIRTVSKFAKPDDPLFDELLSEAGLILANSLKAYDARQTRFITYGGRYLFSQLASFAKQYRERQFCELLDYVSPAVEDNLELAEDRFDAARLCGEVLSELHAVLRDSERQVIEQRLKGETFAKIGQRSGISRQRAQQLFANARKKARTMFPSLVEACLYRDAGSAVRIQAGDAFSSGPAVTLDSAALAVDALSSDLRSRIVRRSTVAVPSDW